MTYIEPDPRIVQKIALEALRVATAQRRDVAVGAAIYDRFDRPMLSQDSFRAWHDAACAEYDRLAAALPKLDERQDKPCPCGCPVVEDMCSCPTPCPCEPDCGFCMVPNPMRQPDPAHVAREQQAEHDDDVQALSETIVRLKAWLAGRQANVHSEISTTSVIAEPRDRSTAAWAIAESDVAAVVAALEARTTTAGE